MSEKVIFTKGRNAVLLCQKEDPTFLEEVDALFQGRGEEAFVLGQYPVLSTGYLQPSDFSCFCPQNGTLAVSDRCFSQTGKLDETLGWAASADYLFRLKQNHFSCGTAYSVKSPSYQVLPEDITEIWVDSLLFDYKHGNFQLRKNVLSKLWKAIKTYDMSIGNYSRKKLLSSLPKMLISFIRYTLSGEGERSESFDFFRQSCLRGCYVCPERKTEPLVSVVIRTHRRPEVLRKTLDLLRQQTYQYYEVVLIEDGEPTAREMVEEDFKDIPIRYFSTGTPIGRSAAANLGFSLSKGKYLNLLDDDDYLYPEHLELAVSVAERDGVDVVFVQDLSLSIEKKQDTPYEFEVNEAHFMNFPRIDPFTMSHFCATPDNGVFFRKEVLDYAVGMREDLDANEDWSLWLRMLTKATYSVVHFASCCFVVPFNEQEKEERIRKYSAYNGLQIKDDLLKYDISGEQISSYYQGVIDDFAALEAAGILKDHLQHELFFWNVEDAQQYLQFAEEFQEKATKKESGTYTSEDFVRYYLGMVAKKQKDITAGM